MNSNKHIKFFPASMKKCDSIGHNKVSGWQIDVQINRAVWCHHYVNCYNRNKSPSYIPTSGYDFYTTPEQVYDSFDLAILRGYASGFFTKRFYWMFCDTNPTFEVGAEWSNKLIAYLSENEEESYYNISMHTHVLQNADGIGDQI